MSAPCRSIASLLAIVVGLLVGCGSSASLDPAQVPLRHASDVGIGPDVPCAGIGMEVLRIEYEPSPEPRIMGRNPSDPTRLYTLSWPDGYTATMGQEGLEIRDPDGTIAVREGDELSDVAVCLTAELDLVLVQSFTRAR
jgi:hypothetical protein